MLHQGTFTESMTALLKLAGVIMDETIMHKTC